jgi:hypothetical protein
MRLFFSFHKAKLEAELKSMQLHQEERYETQSRELNHVQENIMYLVSDVDEMRRRLGKLAIESN